MVTKQCEEAIEEQLMRMMDDLDTQIECLADESKPHEFGRKAIKKPAVREIPEWSSPVYELAK